MKRLLTLHLILVIWLIGALYTPVSAADDEPTPEPGMENTTTSITDRLDAPAIPENPSQADRGSLVYYGVCMACHGDKGQGLTDEWRAIWEEDSNCWQSGCHGPDHPPWGFSIPETCCTAVIGPNTLLKYQNGQELFDYITTTMPWWNPGYLKQEEFWQVTAFLLREHGGITDQITLDSTNAAAFVVNPASPPVEASSNGVLLIGGMLIIVVGLVAFQYRRTK